MPKEACREVMMIPRIAVNAELVSYYGEVACDQPPKRGPTTPYGGR